MAEADKPKKRSKKSEPADEKESPTEQVTTKKQKPSSESRTEETD